MGYTMVVSEKSEAAARIAKALDDDGRPEELRCGAVTYFKARKSAEVIFVVPAVGHLFNVAPEGKSGLCYPVFNVVWKPVYKVKRGARHLIDRIEAFSKVAREASRLVSGTDFDMEGELIGYNILKYACGRREKEAKRMVFSTLTEGELRRAFENLLPRINFGLAEAGEARHILDFLWGVNLSRAMTVAAKNQSGGYHLLSVGRVQAPTLKFVVDREKEIQSFVPVPYWEASAEIEVSGKVFEAKYEKRRIPKLSQAEDLVKKCSGGKGFVEDVNVRTFKQSTPNPFNLGDLQRESYRVFRYVPSQTLKIAERLYLDALISYPRTSSQKLPKTIDYKTIISSFSRVRTYKGLVEELLTKGLLKPKEGEKDDPAHPSIYPTGNLPDKPLPPSHRRLFDLVVRRFFSVFSNSAVKQGVRIRIDVGGEAFILRGRRILDLGWLRFYEPYVDRDEVKLPELIVGQSVVVRKIRLEEKYTSPPPRYNPSSLLAKMDERGIGTKTTRASIIDTLYRRGYIRGERMEATGLGFKIVEALEAYCPKIISVELTREFAEKIGRIEVGEARKETVLVEAVNVLKDILMEIKENEEVIGKELSEAVREARGEALSVGVCPICGSGRLMILRSRRTGKRFVGCSNFASGSCKASFPLPQPPYKVKTVKTPCRKCGWPRVLVKPQGKRPWYLCLNPNCPGKSRMRGEKP